MKVVNTIPFSLIYSIVEHPHLGYLIEPHVVQINSLGKLTLSHQKLFPANLDYYAKEIDEKDRKLVKLLEDLDQDKIVKRFHKKLTVRAAEYFQKFYTPEIHKGIVRPFIERKLLEIIPLLADRKIFLATKDGNPAGEALVMSDQPANVLFHFRRNSEGTNYFPTIKCGGELVEFKGNQGVLLTMLPAWFINDGVLYHFEKQVDGNKLKPFLSKKFIHIPKSTELKYFQNFVVPLIEKYDVFAKGFEIRTKTLEAKPILNIDPNWGDGFRLNLEFRYDNHTFHYHSGKKVSVFLDVADDEYVFNRIQRNKRWEEEQKEFIEYLGLDIVQGSSFKVRSGEHALDWLFHNQEELNSRGFVFKQSQEKRYFIGSRKLELETKDMGDWFDVQAVILFGEFEIPFAKLRQHIKDGIKEFILPNGEVAILPDEWFARLNELFELSLESSGLRLNKHHYPLLESLQSDWERNELIKRLENSESWNLQVPSEPGSLFTGQLRPYQLDGFRWFYFLKMNRFGGCLADDMGLGKTIQALALLATEIEINNRLNESKVALEEELEPAYLEGEEEELEEKRSDMQMTLFHTQATQLPVITQQPISNNQVNMVIAPTSLVYNWLNESATFAPQIRVLVHSGPQRGKTPAAFDNYDLIITTYGVLRLDIEWMSQMKFNYVILDESQAIKNPASLTSKAVKELNATYRLVLTGTPIENTVTDLWSQMNFINPGLLGSYSYFQKRFAIPIDKEGNEKAKERLHQLISPFVLRRTKKQVAKDLPDKYELVHYCEMTEEQEKLYEETKSSFRNRILEVVSTHGIGRSKLQILKGLILLRQISNHPRLTESDFLGESGKFIEITRMVETAMQEGHKILLFSQFVKHLSLFREYFDGKNIEYAYLDGATGVKDRMKEVDRFNNDPNLRIFLISLKAGGTGLNLTSADYVFLADPWWNPSVEQQAMDRAHRIGQTQNVFSYKFITKNSIEEKILALQKRKMQLSDNLIISEDVILKNIDIVELNELLE